MPKKRLIYIHVGLSSFVKKDIEILQETFELSIHEFDLTHKKRLPFTLIKQKVMLLRRLRKSDGVVVQFAGYQSYLPTRLARLFNRKCMLILGGTDTVSFPSLQYGSFNKKYLGYATRKSLERASLLIPVSDTLIEYDYTYSDDDFPKQGYKFHAPSVKTPVQTVFNGYSSDKWFIGASKEPNSFITIAADLGTRFGMKLKGIDLIIEIAEKLPACTFYIVGGNKLNVNLPSNVFPIGNMPHDQLPKFIADKQFYLQLSMSEGFPNALCEGMLSGCVPIVSNVGAMPMIVGDTGHVLLRKNSELLLSLIEFAQKSYTPEDAQAPRKRIIAEYSLTRRTSELTELITKHISL